MNDKNISGLSLQRERMRFIHGELHPIQNGKELKQRFKELPVMLRTNGLATVSAQLAAGESRDGIIAEMLARWILEKTPIFNKPTEQTGSGKAKTRLINRCMAATISEYELMQMEALAFLEQAKLMAAALWPKE
ncbi:MAG: type III-B CRISPR module-associated protein Cmr5 [Desulfobacterium sp.]